MAHNLKYDLDTTPEAEAQYIQLLRSAPVHKRVSNFFRLRQMGKVFEGEKMGDSQEDAGIIKTITEIFAQLNIAYALCGSIASSLYGKARFTNDIDIIVALKPHHVPSLIVALDPQFHIDEQTIHKAVHTLGRDYVSFNIFHKATFLKIDLFVAHADHQQRQLDSARALPIGETFVANVISPEETILSKLRWHQISESERQIRDILGIVQVQGDDLDVAYLQENAGEVLDLLMPILGGTRG